MDVGAAGWLVLKVIDTERARKAAKLFSRRGAEGAESKIYLVIESKNPCSLSFFSLRLGLPRGIHATSGTIQLGRAPRETRYLKSISRFQRQLWGST